MELCRVHIVLPNRRGKHLPVRRARRDNRFILGSREKTVDEINIAPVFNSFEYRAIRTHNFKLVPANLWHFQAGLLWKTYHASFEKCQARGATIEFFTALKEGLITDTNSQKWPARRDELFRAFEEFLFLHRCDAII